MNIHASVNARVNTSIVACMHTRVCIRVHICMHIYVHRCIHVHTHTHTHTHTNMYAHTHIQGSYVYIQGSFSEYFLLWLGSTANTLPTRDSTAYIIVVGKFRANAPSAARAYATPSGVAANAARRQLGQAAAEPVCVQYCEKLCAANGGVAGGRVGAVCGERGPEHAAGRSPAGLEG